MKMWRILMMVALAAGLVGLTACNDDDGPTKVEIPPTVLSGTFTLDTLVDPINDVPDTDAFDGLLSQGAMGFAFTFHTVTGDYQDYDMIERSYHLDVGPVSVTFSGDDSGYLTQTVAPTFAGAEVGFEYVSEGGGSVSIQGNLFGESGAEYFGLEIHVHFAGTLNNEGYPVLQDVEEATGSFILRRYTNADVSTITDMATGDATVSLTGTADLVFAE